MANSRPVYEARLGRIKARVFANRTDTGIRYSTSLVRLYKDADKWQSSTYFDREDLPLVSKVSDMAHTWIYLNNEHGEPSLPEASPGDVDGQPAAA